MIETTKVTFTTDSNLFKAVLESLPECVFVKDINGVYVYVNTACAKVFGKSVAEVIGQDDTAFFAPDTAAGIKSVDRQVIETGQLFNYSETVIGNNGEVHTYLTDKSAYRNAAGQIIGVMGISRDVSPQQKAEESQREAQELLQGVLDNAPLPIYTVTSAEKFELTNRQFADFIKSDYESLSGKKIDEVLQPGDAHRIREINHRIVESGKPLIQEEWFDQDNGRHYYKTYKFPVFDADKKVKSVGAMLFDLTEHKRAEDRFRAVIESTASAILMVDADGKIVLVNSEAERLFDYRRDELIGQSVDMLVPDYLRPRHPDFRRTYYNNPRPVKYDASRDFYCRRKDGTEIPIEIGLDYLTTAEGSFVLVSIVDITHRKQAERALRDSEERLQLALKVSSAGIWDWNFKQNKLFWSPEHFAIFGYEPHESGVSSYEMWEKCLHADDVEFINRTWRRATTNDSLCEVEYRIIRADNGETRWLSAVGQCFFDKNKEPQRLVGVITDITERKAAEQAILVSQTSLLLAAEAAALGTWDFNYSNKYFLASEQLLRIFGLSQDFEATIDDFNRLIHPDDIEFVLSKTSTYASSKQVIHLEYRIVHRKTKQIKWIATSARTFFTESGEPIRNVGVVQDITERKLAEQALRQSEERYRQLIEFAPTSIFLATADGTITHVNPAACQLLGYNFEELVGMSIVNFQRSSELDKLNQILADSGVGNEHRGEWQLLRKDGSWIWVECEARVLPNGHWQAFITDISARKKVEEQLRQSQKMEAVGRLAGGVAHDFNNLLTVITGYSELMLWKLHKEDPFYKNVHEIKRAAERAAGLTGQLLAFSRQQPQQLVILNLNYVIENLKKMLNRVLSEDIRLSTSLDDELGSTMADQGQIEQILMNLVVNARDAMAESGDRRILIETKNVHLTEELAKLNLEAKPGLYVSLIVSDTGGGMDSETKAQIFEPFFTTKEAGKGTGLGLSTVYGIVKQSGGFINVYSEKGYGTTFKIYLPRVDQPAIHITGEQKPLTTEIGTETILLVEDDEMVRQLVKEVLEMSGYRVLEANNGATALLVCDKYQKPIHLLLTDIVMPEMSGRKLAERLIAAQPEMQVIYMSGYTNDTVIHHGISTNAVNFIEKPFKFEDLTAKIREVLDKKIY